MYFVEHQANFVISIVPADGLPPLGAGTPPGTQ